MEWWAFECMRTRRLELENANLDMDKCAIKEY